SSAVLQAAAAVASAPEVKEKTPEKSPAKTPSRSSPKKQAAPPTPGAFPDDDEEEEEWIAPPAVPEKDHIESSPRPALPKSYTADIMEGIHGMDSVSGAEFVLPKQRQAGSRSTSPQRGPVVPERTTSTLGHTKSASVSVLPELGMASGPAGVNSPLKAISVSNPALTSVSETGRPQTPKSPSRSFRDSPLKQVKNKLSSIIKSSRGLLASSAAISAEGKSLLSPSSTRLGFHADPSASSLATLATAADSLYPDLSQRATNDAPVVSSSGSPTRPVAKRTRSSTEREKEEKRKEKETQKEARLMNEQMDKLEKAREKEREKAPYLFDIGALALALLRPGAIPFAPNPNPAGPSHKTPARPQGAAGAKSAAKSATRSSPRFQNGESIELPEIDTDDEDEEEDDANFGAAAWVDSPELRRALTRQETMDPSQIFGPPAPLVMEEVFSKSKDRWHKFRARTSSANWSGTDRLTEDEIRKDLVARDRMRKDGAWTFEMSKDLA
ncbi:hypothetical protein BN1723_000847, partial [Verticillium longisporum]